MRRRSVVPAWSPRAAALLMVLGPFSVPLAAQLNEQCMVSALNRTARVQPDGSWVLPNVPANQGPVRVRATCVAGTLTRSGQSDLVSVPPNNVLKVDTIVFDAPQPIPVSLSLTAPRLILSTFGETLPLSASATYPGGTVRNVTGSAAGTSYRSSNPALAGVSDEGVVTARASGRVLISALNEGALGVLSLQVITAGDADGDGLPDDWELANGLDPNNSVDALKDPDQDGLTTLEEYQLGLLPFDPDTDDDTLRDGDEVNQYGTNPLLRDTDGDEVPDGLEILSGSNPLDPASINLPPILASLTATPDSLDLVFDTAVGETSQRLDVRGTLIDGTVINLRLRSRGTNYASSDLTVANFGSEDGRIFAGQNGTATVTVGNAGRSDTVQVRVTTFSPTALAFLSIPGFANGVAVDGSYAYVASGSAGLFVVDVSNPLSPVIAGSLNTPGNANDVKVASGYAYVVDGASGLLVVDVSNPASPLLVGQADTPGIATDLAVRGDLVYVADGVSGLQIFDVSNRAAPVRIGSLDTPGNARGIDVGIGIAVVADGPSGVQVIDVSNPASPRRLGTAQTRVFYSLAASVTLRGRYAYVADADGFNLGGLRVLDLAEPATPAVVARTSDAFALTGVALDRNLALTSDGYFVNSVPIFDLGRDGNRPTFTSQVNFSGSPRFRDDNGNDVAVQGGLVFMVGVRNQITDNGVAGDTGLHIGRYRTPREEEDRVPEVTLTAPAPGSSFRERSPLTLRADATDDFQVASVQFLVDGTPVFEDFRAPYEATITVPAGRSGFTVSAVAIDVTGNRSPAHTVSVGILPDDKPTAAFVAPLADARFVEGSTVEFAVSASDDVRVDQVQLLVDGVEQGGVTVPPYRFQYTIPIGSTQLDVRAVATDSVGQTAEAVLLVGVDDNPPPVVSVLEPSATATLIEGARLRVAVGAVDDVGVERVTLALNGGSPQEDRTAPYQFSIVVPSGSPTLRLTATATDTLGEASTSEIELSVAPDPATTASGRVVDAQGQGLPGATVRCFDRTTTSGAGGAFTLPGLPTLPGVIACTATGSDSGGLVLSGSSPVVPPVIGGVTELGDIRVVGQLLYLGSGNGPSASEGRLYVLDSGGSRLVPWSRSYPPAGLSGLAFDAEGRLYATTEPFFGGGESDLDLSAPKQRMRRRTARAAVTPDAGLSNLLHLDPDTGAVLASYGPFVTPGPEGGAVALQDPTYDPADGQIYALQSGFGPGPVPSLAPKAFSAGTLYRLDLESLVATPVTHDLPFDATGLAAGPDGLLYTLAPNSEGSQLLAVDPATGAIVSEQFINGTIGVSFSREVGGMVARPGTGTFLLTSINDGTEIYELDPVSGLIADFLSPDGFVEGVATGLAFRPLDGAAPVTTTITGRVEDADGNPIEGAEVATLGGTTLTGTDGRFAFPDVVVRTGAVRASATSGEDFSLSPSVPPLPGVTDLGTIVLGAPACVVGTLAQFGCLESPVSETFDLFLLDEFEQQTLVGTVTPDADGRFCAVLRRRQTYFLRREDLVCSCGTTTRCETPLALFSPGASGVCGDPDAVCEDLGDLFLSCDFFCGGS